MIFCILCFFFFNSVRFIYISLNSFLEMMQLIHYWPFYNLISCTWLSRLRINEYLSQGFTISSDVPPGLHFVPFLYILFILSTPAVAQVHWILLPVSERDFLPNINEIPFHAYLSLGIFEVFLCIKVENWFIFSRIF